MFIAGFRDASIEINPIDAKEDLNKAVNRQQVPNNPTATAVHLDNSNEWDVSNVIDMSFMFRNTLFNASIDDWDVSNVINMEGMFRESIYNFPLNNWPVSSVTNMEEMFSESKYNHPLNNWNVSSVTNMEEMFSESKYNHPLNNWNVSNVLTMAGMFHNSRFNKSLNKWKVNNVTDMSSMFYKSRYNKPLNNWNVGNVTHMYSMFCKSKYNHPLGCWDVSNVEEMHDMFKNSNYNHPLNDWVVNNVHNTSKMFKNSKYNHPLDKWIMENLLEEYQMFLGSDYTYPIPENQAEAEDDESEDESEDDESEDDESDDEDEESEEVSSPYMIKTVPTALSTDTYNPLFLIDDFISGGKIKIEDALSEFDDAIVLLNDASSHGTTIRLSDIKKNITEFVECKDDTPEGWQANAYIRDYIKPGGREMSKIMGPYGTNMMIEKPDWFYDGPVPFDRVFRVDTLPERIRKFMTTEILPVPPNYEATNIDHCNQKANDTREVFILVGLTRKISGGKSRKKKSRNKKVTIRVNKF